MSKYQQNQAEYIAWQIVQTTEDDKLDAFIRLVLEEVRKKREETKNGN